MAIYKILNTSKTEPNYEMVVELDGKTFILVFNWNQRFGRWILSAYTTNRQVIFAGHALTINYPVAFRVKDERMWDGTMYCLGRKGAGDPSLYTFTPDNGETFLAYRPSNQ